MGKATFETLLHFIIRWCSWWYDLYYKYWLPFDFWEWFCLGPLFLVLIGRYNQRQYQITALIFQRNPILCFHEDVIWFNHSKGFIIHVNQWEYSMVRGASNYFSMTNIYFRNSYQNFPEYFLLEFIWLLECRFPFALWNLMYVLAIFLHHSR